MFNLESFAFSCLNWLTPTTGYQLQKNIAYGEHGRQRLDVYHPLADDNQKPLLIFFYGGSWQKGCKHHYRFVAQPFCRLGYRVVIPDYRVYPDVLFPGFMADAASVVAYAVDRFKRPVVLIGHSAGAHIAAMLALDKSYIEQTGIAADVVQGWVGLSGPYDFLPLKSDVLKTIFNGADDIRQTQPINLVSPQSPPALLVHGLRDELVKPANTKILAIALKDHKVPVSTRLYPKARHGVTVASLAKPLRYQLPVQNDICQFLSSL